MVDNLIYQWSWSLFSSNIDCDHTSITLIADGVCF